MQDKKKRITLTFGIPERLNNKIEEEAEREIMTRSEVIRRALVDFFVKKENQDDSKR